MAYVLGYLYADGSMEDAFYLRGKYIRVSSVERINIEKIQALLDSKHTITIHDPKNKPYNGRPRYMLRIGNQTLYNSLLKHGLYPNKSLSIALPLIPSQYFADFVRGYFDGDGCVHIERTAGKVQSVIINRLSVIFTCGSKKFLEQMNEKLTADFGLSNRTIHACRNAFQLRYSTTDSVKIFILLYKNTPPSIYSVRKFNTFKEYFEQKPHMVDKMIENVLHCHSVGHVVK